MNSPVAPTVALVPLRSPGVGKTRLADGLAVEERARLSSAMLADVASALRRSPVDRIVVVASGPAAAAAARALRLDVVLDPPGTVSLDAALAAAQGRVREVGTLLVAMADLPRLRPDDIGQALEVDASVVVAATTDGGTGGLVRRPPSVISTAYGRHSAVRHLRLASDAGVDARTVDLPGFRHDVDTWSDVLALRAGSVGPATAAFLDTLGSRLEPTG